MDLLVVSGAASFPHEGDAGSRVVAAIVVAHEDVDVSALAQVAGIKLPKFVTEIGPIIGNVVRNWK